MPPIANMGINNIYTYIFFPLVFIVALAMISFFFFQVHEYELVTYIDVLDNKYIPSYYCTNQTHSMCTQL